jgi:hypothetical protein
MSNLTVSSAVDEFMQASDQADMQAAIGLQGIYLVCFGTGDNISSNFGFMSDVYNVQTVSTIALAVLSSYLQPGEPGWAIGAGWSILVQSSTGDFVAFLVESISGQVLNVGEGGTSASSNWSFVAGGKYLFTFFANVANGQPVITAAGILKADGAGNVSAAVEGTDYARSLADVLSASGINPVGDYTYAISSSSGGSVTTQGGIITSWNPAM